MIKEAGTAGSSNVAHSDHLAEYAFLDAPGKYWKGSNIYPQYIWFHFSTPHILGGIGFTVHRNAFAPKDFEVVGSNDCSNWKPLLEAENPGYPEDSGPHGTGPEDKYDPPEDFEEGLFKFWHTRETSRVPYECFGLKIYSVRFGDIPEVKNITMWEVMEEGGDWGDK